MKKETQKNRKTEEDKEKKVKKTDSKKLIKDKLANHPFIKGMRITEKSSLAADKGQYTFNVDVKVNKSEIKKAIKTLYKVEPVKVTITQIPSKKVVRGGRVGFKSRGKKAVVYLKKGDKIEFV